MRCYPPTAPFPKQRGKGSSDSIQQSAPHQLFSSTFPISNRQQHEGHTNNLKRYRGHFSTTHCLKMQKASTSRPLEPGKGSRAQTLSAYPASPSLLGIPLVPRLRHELPGQDIISHSRCLVPRPMVLPSISTVFAQQSTDLGCCTGRGV